MNKEILTRKEAADYIGICLSSFAKIQNQISQIKIGRNVRFYKKDIGIFLEKKKVEGHEKNN